MTTMKPESLALHAGYRADPTTNAVAVPIYQTTSYQFNDSGHAARLFDLSEMGNIYTRVMNPTNDVFEQRIAAIEGGVAALALSSGQGATTLSVLNVAQAGDNIVSSTDLYGGTWNLFANTMKTMGIEVRFVDPEDPENFRRATDERTRAYYAETLPNPKLQVFPIREVAAIGEELGVPLIMDNTASPIICRPFDHGAHIIVHSCTKYIGGHGNSIGGVIVDSGTFDWVKHAKRFPLLNQPDPSYHGAVWTEATKELGPVAYIVKARCTLQRDLGLALSPFNTFNFIQGLETLSLRMREHCRNAQAVADFLAKDPRVAKVIYPGMTPEDRSARTETYLPEGKGVPLIMDNTASPIICRPFDHGAHIIVHSCTKYIGGHGNSIGGVIVDSGTFDWVKHAKRFPLLNQPDPSYHGAVWTEATKELGPVAYIVKARCTLQRDLGLALSPFNTFNFIQGLETLSLRMREHCRNAQAVADFLAKDPRVAKVIYPGMTPEDRSARTETYLPEGKGGLVGFEIKDATTETGAAFIDALQMIYHVANIGDTRTLAIHPSSTTHQQLKPEEQLATGVTPGYLRLSVGIEHIDDILADIDQALTAAVKGTARAA